MEIRKVHPRVLIVTEGLGTEYFGASQVILKIVDLLHQNHLKYKVIVTRYGKVPSVHRPYVIRAPMVSSFKGQVVTPYLCKFLKEQVNMFSPSVIHVHGVFTGLQQSIVKIAKKSKVPVLLSVHGMHEPGIWMQQGILKRTIKRMYWQLMLRPMLRKVNRLHTITPMEAETLQMEFPQVPQVLIPNAIDLRAIKRPDIPIKRKIIFLGRLHPIKGVDMLLRAFANAKLNAEWRLDIIGPAFDPGYTRRLKGFVESADLQARVNFLGPVYGIEKYRHLAAAWVTVVPSYSEVVALVNLESAAVCTPSITTTTTGLHDWGESGGLLIKPELNPLVDALNKAASWTDNERRSRGRQAREFVSVHYSWQAIGPRWISTYENIAISK